MHEFSIKTNMGWIILEKYKDVDNSLFVIVCRPKREDFAWGSYYNEDIGQWGQGHYDYKTLSTARKDMLERYPNLKQTY